MKILTQHPIFHDPNYPSEENLSATQKNLVIDFNTKVKNNEIGFERAPCLCNSNEIDLVSSYDRYRVWQPIGLCRSCGLMRCDPRLTDDRLNWFYGSDYYRELYTSGGNFGPSDKFEYDQLAPQSRVFKTVGETLDVTTIKRVAEFGCGAGHNLYPFY